MAQAATTLNFPRLSFEPGRLTGVALVNPGSQDAVVTLTAFGADGQPLAGIPNPVQVTVKAGEQFSALTAQLFPGTLDPATVAWFQAVSGSDDLTGFFLFLDDSVTLLDGADLPSSATKIIFNQVRTGNGYSTELDLVNPGTQSLTVQIAIVDPVLSPAGREITIPAKGVVRLDVAQFFSVSSLAMSAYVTASADQEMAGFELVTDPGGELLGLNARGASEQLTHLFFPQLAVLGGWQTRLGLVNYSTEAAIATISVFRPDGTLYDATVLDNNPVIRSLAGGASLVEDVETMFGFRGTTVLDGWIEVESTSPALNGQVSYGQAASGAVAAVTPVANGSTRALFSHIATSGGFFTGLAVLNSGALATDLRILAMQPDGTILGSFDQVLQPGERISKLLNEIIPAAAGQSGGIVWVKSQLPVYLTSLFGTAAVLANVPPQPAPQGYDPDQALPQVTLSPPLAVVQPQDSQTFSLTASGSALWKVNGIPGGNALLGTVDSTGLYTAPVSVPDPQVVTVSAEVKGQSAGASVDVVEKDALFGSLGVVLSVAYLDNLARLFTAELSVLGGAPAPAGLRAVQSSESDVFEVTASGKTTLASFPGEEVSKMIPFTASTGQEFLLLSGKTTGRVIRLDPLTGQSVDVATGLDQPTSLVLDPVSDTLLVAEQTQVSSIARTQLEVGLVSAALKLSSVPGTAPAAEAVRVFPSTAGDGVAVDACTGNIYFWDRKAGAVRQYVRATGEVNTIGSGIQSGQLLSLYRHGVSCPESFRLLVASSGATRIWLVDPIERSVRRWLLAEAPRDLIFLPRNNPLTQGKEGVLLTELPGGKKGRLTFVRTSNLYQRTPSNPPSKDRCLGDLVFADPNLETAVRGALSLAAGDPVTCEAARSVTTLNFSTREIRNLKGLENFSRLRSLTLNSNVIRRLNPLEELVGLTSLSLANNPLKSLRPLRALTALRTLNLAGDGISDLGFLARLLSLRNLGLSDNQIQSIDVLSALPNLKVLNLARNSVDDLRALVDNPGLGSGDLLLLQGNPLDSGDCADIQALLERGVDVRHDVSCP